LYEAEFIIGLCDRFHTVPSVVKQEEAGIISLLKIYHLGHIEDEGAPREGGEHYAERSEYQDYGY
jgi:hypothetical protein